MWSELEKSFIQLNGDRWAILMHCMIAIAIVFT
jgi:hypothetical protein